MSCGIISVCIFWNLIMKKKCIGTTAKMWNHMSCLTIASDQLVIPELIYTLKLNTQEFKLF